MKFVQAPHTILMVRPYHFGSNPETAASNAFQQQEVQDLSERAREEFDLAVDRLRAHQIDVIVVEDTDHPLKPDAVFPNNWFTTHPDGHVVFYPMMAASRRQERRQDVVQLLQAKFAVQKSIDLSPHESEGHYLEGTGSIIFDHPNRIAYCCESPRSSRTVFEMLCKKLEYESIFFHAADRHGQAIYHTNVMMWVGSSVAGLCLDSIRDVNEQEWLLNRLNDTGHRVVSISFDQMSSFAGNMIEVLDQRGEKYLLMSQAAYDSLVPGQIKELQKHAHLLPISIPTIERGGGGSIRCMVAGIHLPGR